MTSKTNKATANWSAKLKQDSESIVGPRSMSDERKIKANSDKILENRQSTKDHNEDWWKAEESDQDLAGAMGDVPTQQQRKYRNRQSRDQEITDSDTETDNISILEVSGSLSHSRLPSKSKTTTTTQQQGSPKCYAIAYDLKAKVLHLVDVTDESTIETSWRGDLSSSLITVNDVEATDIRESRAENFRRTEHLRKQKTVVTPGYVSFPQPVLVQNTQNKGSGDDFVNEETGDVVHVKSVSRQKRTKNRERNDVRARPMRQNRQEYNSSNRSNSKTFGRHRNRSSCQTNCSRSSSSFDHYSSSTKRSNSSPTRQHRVRNSRLTNSPRSCSSHDDFSDDLRPSLNMASQTRRQSHKHTNDDEEKRSRSSYSDAYTNFRNNRQAPNKKVSRTSDTEESETERYINNKQLSRKPKLSQAAYVVSSDEDDSDSDDDPFAQCAKYLRKATNKREWTNVNTTQSLRTTSDRFRETGSFARDAAHQETKTSHTTTTSSDRLNRTREQQRSNNNNNNNNNNNMRRTGPVSTQPESSNEDEIDVGDSIEARYKGKSKWYKGRVTRVRSNGSFDIDYADRDKEAGVRQHLVRRVSNHNSTRISTIVTANATNNVTPSAQEASKQQDLTRCLYLVRSEGRVSILSFPGILRRVWGQPPSTAVRARLQQLAQEQRIRLSQDLTTDQVKSVFLAVCADHMAEQGAVNEQNISTPTQQVSQQQGRAKSNRVGEWQQGDSVMARYGSNPCGSWVVGTVVRVRANGTYDIRFVDGDSEQAVRPQFIKSTTLI